MKLNWPSWLRPQNKYADYSLTLLLLLLPWQTRWILTQGIVNGHHWDYTSISLSAIQLLAVVAVILNHRTVKLIWHHQKTRIFLFILALTPLIAATTYGLTTVTIYLELQLCLALLIGALIFYRPDLQKLFLTTFIAGAVLAAGCGLWQFCHQQAMPEKWLGLSLHDPQTLGVAVVEAVAPDGVSERWLRAYRPFPHPNIFGGYLALAIIILAWLILTRTPTIKKNRAALAGGALIILTWGLTVSFSRAAWLATGVGLLILLITNRKLWRRWLEIIVIVVVSASLAIVPNYYLFTGRLDNDNRLNQISTHERRDGWQQAGIIFQRQPWLGVGMGNYGSALTHSDPQNKNYFYQPVASAAMLSLVELGVIGWLAMLICLILLIIKILQAKEQRGLKIALLVALIIFGSLDHWLWSLGVGIFVTTIILGFLG